jgi:hypothetical protein
MISFNRTHAKYDTAMEALAMIPPNCKPVAWKDLGDDLGVQQETLRVLVEKKALNLGIGLHTKNPPKDRDYNQRSRIVSVAPESRGRLTDAAERYFAEVYW